MYNMNNLKTSVITLFLSSLLLYLHIRGMVGHLYLNYWFYDLIQHFLGGACIALATACTAEVFDIKIIKENLKSIIIVTFIGGFAWEVFELMYDIAGHDFGTREYNIDTIKDLIMDTLGGVLVYFSIKKR